MFELSIRLLGSPIVERAGNAQKFALKKSQALLIYCLLNKDPISRVQLCDLFYPDHDESTARRRLSNLLFRLNRDLNSGKEGNRILLSMQDSIQVCDNSNYYCDVEEFIRQTDAALLDSSDLRTLEQAAVLYRGAFLEGFHITDAVDFEEWAANRRSALELRYHNVLRILSTQHILNGNYLDAIRWLNRLLVGNGGEDLAVYGLLMICYGVTGRNNQAEQVYSRYVSVMHESFQMAPDPSMQKLHETIRRRQLSDKHAKNIITNAIQEAWSTTDDVQLQQTLSAVLKSLGLRPPPPESRAYVRVLQHAREEAQEAGFGLVGTPHLFLSLCTENLPSGFAIFTPMQLKKIVDATRFVLGKDTHQSIVPTTYTLELQNIFQEAGIMAEAEAAASVDLRHLWKALLQSDNKMVVQILERYGGNSADVMMG